MTTIKFLLLAGMIFTFIWIILLIVGTKKYSVFIKTLSIKKYRFKSLYPIGLIILDISNYKYKSRYDRNRLYKCKALFGNEYYEYYFRINWAAKISVILTALLFATLIYPLTGRIELIYVMLFLGGVSYFLIDDAIVDKYKKREEELLNDFPSALSKLTLLINAGLIIKEAWEQISISSNTILYKEMQKTNEQINNGMSQVDAYIDFGVRCSTPKIKKISSTLAQTLAKGNVELTDYLQEASKEMWEEKKHMTKRKGEEASSKLLIPIGLMFIGILVLIGLPMASSLKL